MSHWLSLDLGIARRRIAELETALRDVATLATQQVAGADNPLLTIERTARNALSSERINQPMAIDLEQPAPIANDEPAVWDLVVADMVARDAVGRARYGTRLQPHNGRDALADAYAEALDLCVYMRQALYERDGK